jgi:hypothetical protein
MVVVTPGIDFLAVKLCSLSLPPLGAIALGKLNEQAGGTPIPTRVLVLAGIASIPFITIFRITAARLKHKSEAAALGAKMIPSNLGTKLGNADVLATVQHNFLHGYPGMNGSFHYDFLG